jgi:hypothetical protein
VATGTTAYFRLYVASATNGLTALFDNISVKELPGNHATQGTAASRPTLARVPEGGRRNLLERTEEFDNAYWSTTTFGGGISITRTANAGTDPLGGSTAERVQASKTGTSTSDGALVRNANTLVSSYTGDITLSVWMKSNTGVSQSVWALGTGTDINVVTVTTEWQRFTFTRAVSADNLQFAFNFGVRGTSDNSIDILVWGAQLETASSATAYQKVVSEYDITEAGVDSLDYLSFDGTDDGMATAAIDFTSTDEMSVFAGVRKLDDSTAGIFAEFGQAGGGGALQGSFYVVNREVGADWSFGLKGDQVSTARRYATATAPVTNVLSSVFDFSQATVDTEILPRIDGAVPSLTSVGDPSGSVNFGNHSLYLGARAGTSFFFDGNLYGLIVRGASSDATAISNTETYLANRSGVTLA